MGSACWLAAETSGQEARGAVMREVRNKATRREVMLQNEQQHNVAAL